MAKKPGRPKRSERDDVTARIDRAIKTKAEAVARHKGTSAAEVLSEAARPGVDRAYLQMLRELEESGGDAK